MNNICRTCLNRTRLIPLSNDESLIDKIELLSSIRIPLDYSTSICQDCVDKLNEFCCFRKVILQADNEFQLLNNDLSTNTNDTNNANSANDKKRRSIERCSKRRKKHQDIPEGDVIKSEPNEEESSINNCIDAIKEEADTEIVQCKVELDEKADFNVLHRKYNKRSKSLECVECNVKFNVQRELSNHKRNVHTAPGICNICGVIVRADNLRKHIQKHSETPVSCKICSKVLKNSESLRGHLLIHKSTSFSCEQCDNKATFRLKSEYHRHLKKHSDPNARKKMCTICGKHVRDLHRHLLTHTKERPYVCHFCNKGLTSPYALKLHIRQHTNEKPYVCEFCSKGFAQKISLVAHHNSKVNSCKAL